MRRFHLPRILPVMVPGDDASGGGAAAAASPKVLPLLGPAAQETLRTNNVKAVSATIVPQTASRKTKRSWMWQVFSEFTPSINGKNVFCTVSRHLLSWKTSSGTHGLADHYKVKHSQEHKALMDGHTTVAEGRANITEAIGTFFRFSVFCYAHFSRWVFIVFVAAALLSTSK